MEPGYTPLEVPIITPESGAKILADSLRKRYANQYGNVANFVANAIEHESFIPEGNSPSEIVNSWFVNDIYTMVAEAPLREGFGAYYYENKHSDYHTIRSMLRHANDSSNSQIPQFELKRNRVNYQNFEKTFAGRYSEIPALQDGISVEFSPSPLLTIPETIRTPEQEVESQKIRARGYGRFGTIILSEPGFNEQGERVEKQAQLWFDDLSLSEWQQMVSLMRSTASPDYQLQAGTVGDGIVSSDVDVMGQSGYISREQLHLLQNFLKEKRNISLSDEVLNNVSWVKKQYTQKIWQETRNLVLDAQKNILLNDIPSFEQNLDVLFQTIQSMQVDMKLLLQETFGLQFRDLNLPSISLDQFRSLDLKNQSELLEQYGYEFLFCGGRIARSSSGWSNVANGGSSFNEGLILGIRTKDKPDLSEPCPNCGVRWWIDEKSQATWQKYCPARICQKAIPGC